MTENEEVPGRSADGSDESVADQDARIHAQEPAEGPDDTSATSTGDQTVETGSGPTQSQADIDKGEEPGTQRGMQAGTSSQTEDPGGTNS